MGKQAVKRNLTSTYVMHYHMRHCQVALRVLLLAVFCKCHNASRRPPLLLLLCLACCWPGWAGELLLAEESFGLVSPSVLEGVDNLGMLLLDIVW